MEMKGLVWCQVSMSRVEDSGAHPCGVCRKGVGDNSILCSVSGGFINVVASRES